MARGGVLCGLIGMGVLHGWGGGGGGWGSIVWLSRGGGTAWLWGGGGTA